jgi:hypothetical protein
MSETSANVRSRAVAARILGPDQEGRGEVRVG